MLIRILFFFNTTATTDIYTLSLHDALPIYLTTTLELNDVPRDSLTLKAYAPRGVLRIDRKSTRLNSSHRTISYAVFCLKKKKKEERHQPKGVMYRDMIHRNLRTANGPLRRV